MLKTADLVQKDTDAKAVNAPLILSVETWSRGVAFIDVCTRKGNATLLFRDWNTGQIVASDVPYGQFKIT